MRNDWSGQQLPHAGGRKLTAPTHFGHAPGSDRRLT